MARPNPGTFPSRSDFGSLIINQVINYIIIIILYVKVGMFIRYLLVDHALSAKQRRC